MKNNMHKIINADIYTALQNIDDNSIDIAITSPPYWDQRNYGFDEQIGSESTYMEYISRLVFLFDILKEKLTKKGVFFLNIGDKYLKKYGKTPIGFIPYKLAYFMQKNGWIINDIIIWFKPNHMPSSVKNRFVNSYEPVFVLSKNNNNYFTDYKNNNSKYSNIINVNLQPTSYKHVAAYPEKLVEKLLQMTKINKDYTVLDPFAGSGTTLKVINDNNTSLYSKYKAKGIMIEFNEDYVEMIKIRANIPNIDVEKYPFIKYDFEKYQENNFLTNNNYFNLKNIKTVNIFENNSKFYSLINTIQNNIFIKNFPKKELLFIGLKKFTIEDIYNLSLLNKNKWIVRNMIVVKHNKSWFPVFMLVHDNKTQQYYFNYENLELNHKTNKQWDYQTENFLGYTVVNSLSKEKKFGKIIEILEKHNNGLPKYVIVVWNNKNITKEFVINDEDEIQNNLQFTRLNGFVSVRELQEFIPLTKEINTYNEKNSLVQNLKKNNKYNGKFKEIERKNWGASPGARSSVEEEYFSLQRLYNVNQNIIADYLNYIRTKNNLTKKGFTELFPENYKHTVGHWLRCDFGGSIPVLEDWQKLKSYFDIDKSIENYACKTALKLQTVKKTKYKIPDDVIPFDMIEKLEKLNKPKI